MYSTNALNFKEKKGSLLKNAENIRSKKVSNEPSIFNRRPEKVRSMKKHRMGTLSKLTRVIVYVLKIQKKFREII